MVGENGGRPPSQGLLGSPKKISIQLPLHAKYRISHTYIVILLHYLTHSLFDRIHDLERISIKFDYHFVE